MRIMKLTVDLPQEVTEWTYNGAFKIGARVFKDYPEGGLAHAYAAILSVRTPRRRARNVPGGLYFTLIDRRRPAHDNGKAPTRAPGSLTEHCIKICRERVDGAGVIL